MDNDQELFEEISETETTCYCDYINDTVYCNGVCSQCDMPTLERDEDGYIIWE